MKKLKLLFLTMFLLLITICSAQYEQSKQTTDGIKFLTKDNFNSYVGDPRIIVVIEFWAGWNKLNQCKFLKKLSGCKIYRVDTEGSPALSGKFGIGVVPTIIVFNGSEVYKKFEGNLLFQLPEDVDKKEVQKAIDNIIGDKFE